MIDWKGRRRMQWPGLLHLLFQEYRGPQPQVVLIHLGGNNLGLISGKALINQVIEDLRVLKAQWPGVRVIWSAIIPRMSWQYAIDPRALNKARKNALKDSLGQFLMHSGISVDQLWLYGSDGMHLSEEGLDIFLRDLQQGLKECLGITVGASTKAEA